MTRAGAAAVALAAALAFALAGCAGKPAFDPAPTPETPGPWVDKPGWRAERHMIAAAHPLAVQAGLTMLREGGSAIDAAIAAQMMLTLVEPQSSGIGGGLFLMHFDGRRVQAFDGRETAPAEAGPELFLRSGKVMAFRTAQVGGRSVGTPGALRALELAHRQHGRLPWARLFEPAIEAAERGVPVSARLALQLVDGSAERLRDDPEARRVFVGADGEPLHAGVTMRNPALADTLRRIAGGGADVFYTGEIGRDIVAKVRGYAGNPGLLSEADLAGYRARERTPLCFEHRRHRICGMPPPSSGTLAVAQVMGLLADRDLAAHPPVAAPWGLEPAPEAVHLISEAERLAFADRNRYVADPDFVPVDVAALLDDDYLRRRAALIGEHSMGRAAPGRPRGAVMALADDRSPELPSTTQLAVVDGFGNVLSMTSTIENGFGAQLMVRGFLLNNQLTDFSFVPEVDGQPVANRVQPGKRPRSSMAPLLVFDRGSGAFEMALGSPGGPAIIHYVAKSLIAALDWRLDLQQAFALPNFGSQNGPTELERGRASAALRSALQARGHTLAVQPLPSGAQGIQRQGQGWFGAADPRREGIAAGD